MADIWKDLLGVKTVAPGDDFFQIGGYSLLAFQVVQRLREKLAIDVPLRIIFEASTLREFSAAVERVAEAAADVPVAARMRDRNDSVVDRQTTQPHATGRRAAYRLPRYLEEIRIGTTPTTIVWVGQVRGLEQLTNRVARNASLYLVKLDGLHRDEFEDIPVAERARRFANELLLECPGQRFVICGYCLSALFAFALAEELTARSAEVTAVVFFEPRIPFRDYVVAREANHGARLGVDSEDSGRQSLLTRFTQKIRFRSERLYCRVLQMMRLHIPSNLRWNYFLPAFAQSLQRYAPQPLTVPLVLVAREKYRAVWEEMWRRYFLRGVTPLVIEAPSHQALFDQPHCDDWAVRLDRHLKTVIPN